MQQKEIPSSKVISYLCTRPFRSASVFHFIFTQWSSSAYGILHSIQEIKSQLIVIKKSERMRHTWILCKKESGSKLAFKARNIICWLAYCWFHRYFGLENEQKKLKLIWNNNTAKKNTTKSVFLLLCKYARARFVVWRRERRARERNIS